MQKENIFTICASGNKEALVNLIEKSDDKLTLLSTKCSDGKSMLEIAACFGRINIIEELVKNGLKLEDKSERGYTLLHWCACWGHTEVINYLCNINVIDIYQANIFEETAKHIALRYNKGDCGQLLEKYEFLASLRDYLTKCKQITTDPDKNMGRLTKFDKTSINKHCEEKLEWMKQNRENATSEQIKEKQHELEHQLEVIFNKLK
ncbi:delta-latroinsectotoxin-Lt1a [Hydra vulgaris]|uniref:Delta-latroinsectotoxin-Lt1a n=1 Tax=Hydra vulgaris TaxID=6087 RepID=A0ABM4BCF6_HYDVU